MNPDFFPRFNIAAVPLDTARHADFYRAAHGFRAAAKDYLLSSGEAIPHMTLGQFRAANDKQALELALPFLGTEITASNKSFYIDPCRKEADIFWIGYRVQRSQEIEDIQSKILERLRKSQLEILTAGGFAYDPHFTLARIHGVPQFFQSRDIFTEHLMNNPIPCRIRLGESDECGQFLKTLDGPS